VALDGPWSSDVHFRSEVPPKEIITSRDQVNVQAMESRHAVK
jgi:hypothetical protein